MIHILVGRRKAQTEPHHRSLGAGTGRPIIFGGHCMYHLRVVVSAQRDQCRELVGFGDEVGMGVAYDKLEISNLLAKAF